LAHWKSFIRIAENIFSNIENLKKKNLRCRQIVTNLKEV